MSHPDTGTGHERFEGDAAAYALGALEEHEVRPFEEHIAGCPRCQSDLAAMREAVQALPEAVGPVAVPPELKQRVMADVKADAKQQLGSTPAKRPRMRKRIVESWRRVPLPALAATAGAALAALIVALSVGGGSSARTYAGIVYAPGASASVHVSGGEARLVIAHLPALPARLVYQMWVQRGATPPVPAGALFGTTTGAVTVPGGVRGVQAVLVTAEPRPYGSRAPTRKPLIVVQLRHA
jgi:anti-sigma-K factor RskA